MTLLDKDRFIYSQLDEKAAVRDGWPGKAAVRISYVVVRERGIYTFRVFVGRPGTLEKLIWLPKIGQTPRRRQPCCVVNAVIQVPAHADGGRLAHRQARSTMRLRGWMKEKENSVVRGTQCGIEPG
jgi:hypothetical protein